MTTDTQKGPGKMGWLPTAAAVLAFISCNCAFILVGILAVFGITIAINPHIQAAVISLFTLLTVCFVFLGYRKNRAAGPLILSMLGAVIVVGTMYIAFNKVVESVGLGVLIASAVWSWRAGRVSSK